ncbi:MAG: hypothetical protein P4L85_20910 [Paludisphaera borealis]|uniref:hypothetical protein n=1 Tax=Paludisphaera borealis TaxID=1387353 RepID=UPI00284FE50E|nr:hypothetical protein [Paludisphaera borealis]MDR3621827.1 hypothetical protein [Paludisphaera borealis]
MRTPLARFLGSTLALVLLLGVSLASSGFEDGAKPPSKDPGKAEPQTPIEVNEWSIWVGNPGQTTINSLKFYRNPMPNSVGTSRPKLDDKELAAKFPIAPVSIVQFFGDPSKDVDVDLRVKKGSVLSHWPASKEYTGRLHWFGAELKNEPPAGVPQSYLPDDHWLHKLRENASALYLRYESHYERFIAYDAELTIPIPVKLRGGPDEYTLQNMTNRRLVDVAVIAPSDDGFRVGWLDELPAAATDKQAEEEAKEKEKKAAEAKKAVDPAKKAADDKVKADGLFREAEEKPKEKEEALPPLPAEGDATVQARVDQLLNQSITLVVEHAPRRELLNMVGTQARLRLEFDDRAIAKEKIDLTQPTGLKATGVAIRDALADLLGNVGLSYRVTEEGRLYITTAARLAEEANKKGAVVEGPPVKLVMSQPRKQTDPSYHELTRDAMTRRLEGQGLRKDVVQLILDTHGKALFEPGELIVLAHLARETIDETVVLDVFPPPKKFVRSALVVVHGVDPRLQDRARQLVKQLGDKAYKTRESAESRLLALGPVAVPALEDALRDKDVEIAFRAERLLLKLNRSVP